MSFVCEEQKPYIIHAVITNNNMGKGLSKKDIFTGMARLVMMMMTMMMRIMMMMTMTKMMMICWN